LKNEFGSDLGPMTIGVKNEDKVLRSVGPGEYSPERANSITKPRG